MDITARNTAAFKLADRDIDMLRALSDHFEYDYFAIDMDGYSAWLRKHNGAWEIGIMESGRFIVFDSQEYLQLID